VNLYIPSLYTSAQQIAPKLWMLTDTFVFIVGGIVYKIPALFISDLYSVPLGIIVKRDKGYDIGNIPAWIHDYLVRHRKTLGLSMMDTHNIFREAMRLCGIGTVTRTAKYAAVVLGTWIVAEDGRGTPPREVRAWIDKHGYGC
jgi:hypothetical protein